MNRPVMIAAGGTGGHVFPALAVAEELHRRQVPVVWLGTRYGLEGRVIPDAPGVEPVWLEMRAARGKGVAGALRTPLRLARAVAVALRAVRRHRPRVVLGLGGYVAAPAGVAALLTRTPLVLHEQNAFAGMANRVLAPRASAVLTGFPEASFGRRRVTSRWVGNPVREALARMPAPATRGVGDPQRPLHVLILGGSQGAQALNRHVPRALAGLPAERRPQVLHQTGEATYDEAVAAYRAAGIDDADLRPFIDDMAAAYGWADLVVARAGALTVAELEAVGLGAVLVPLPWAADDHQMRNAEALAGAGAADVLSQADLEDGGLLGLLSARTDDPRRCLRMAEAARRRARPEAARTVADVCLEYAP